MLYDLPALKTEVSDLLLKFFKKTMKQEGLSGQLNRVMQHEGKTGSYSTVQGEVKPKDYQEIGVEFSVNNNEVPDMTMDDAVEIVTTKAREMGQKMGKYVFQTLNKAIDETGNSIDGKGQPLSLELMFQALERIEIPFDDDGQPIMPSMVIHPKQSQKLKELIAEEEKEGKFSERHRLLVEKKRKVWDEKQSHRKLVD